MKGDFSRLTFDPKKRYSGVQMQQGRVQLDADWNEQQAIFAHRLATEATDLIGPSGAPLSSPGFRIIARHGLKFDGQDDYVRVGHHDFLSFTGTTPFTIETWASPTSGSGGGTILGKLMDQGEAVPGQGEYLLEVESDGTVVFRRVAVEKEELIEVVREAQAVEVIDLEVEERSVQVIRSDRPLPFGKFSHIAVTYDGAECKLYVDGEPSSSARFGLLGQRTRVPLLIGARPTPEQPTAHFAGILDNTRLWVTARSQDEIQSSMYLTPRGDEDGLVACWRMDDGGGDTVADCTGRGATGVLGGGTEDHMPKWSPPDLPIGRGRYYVNGTLCENEKEVSITQQPDYSMSALPDLSGSYLVYLDVWQRAITALEDPSIREVALGGPDTTTRTKTVWQAKLLPLESNTATPDVDSALETLKDLVGRSGSKGKMRAERRVSGADLDNRLYRVEVHNGGGLYGWPREPVEGSSSIAVETVTVEKNQITVANWEPDGKPWRAGQVVELYNESSDEQKKPGSLATITAAAEESKTLTLDALPSHVTTGSKSYLRRIATIKWSRDNGSVVLPIRHVNDSTNSVVVEAFGHNAAELRDGDWVEIVDDTSVLHGEANSLCQLVNVDQAQMEVAVQSLPVGEVGRDPSKHPVLRRWDQSGDGAELRNGVILAASGSWTALEDGIQASFVGGGTYETGDYWLIPSRTALEDIEWPREGGASVALPPQGVHHDYACLALLRLDGARAEVTDCRRIFGPLTTGYVRRTGDTIAGSLDVEGVINAALITGTLEEGMVGTEQLLDGAVTFDKLAVELEPVPPGFSVLGDTPQEKGQYAYTGSTITISHPDHTWRPLLPLPSVLTGEVAAAAVSGKVYAFLGAGEVWEYDPAAEEWLQKTNMPNPGPGFAVAAVGGRIHVVGGSDQSGSRSARHDLYSPEADLWETGAPLLTPRSDLAAAVLDGRLYATGGLDRSGKRTGSHEVYHPDRDAWERIAPMPTPRSNLAMAAANGRLYAIAGAKDIFLGMIGEPITGENESYLPIEDRWPTHLTHIPTPRRDLAVAAVGGQLYAIGGLARHGWTAVNELYNPATNTWGDAMPLIEARGAQGVAMVGGDIYLVGGENSSGATNATYVCSVASIYYVHRKTNV